MRKILLGLFSFVLLAGFFSASPSVYAKTTEKQYKQQIEKLKKQVKAKDKEIKSLKSKVSERDKTIKTKNAQIKTKDKDIAAKKKQMADKDKTINAKNKEIADKDKTINAKNKEIADKDNSIDTKNKEIAAIKGNVFTPVSSQLVYQDQTHPSNIKIGNNTVPALVTYKDIYFTPVNALASMLKLGVKFDNTQNKLFVGKGSDGVMMSDILTPYNRGTDINYEMTMGDISYEKGYKFLVEPPESYNFNLQGKYSTISGLIGFEDYKSVNTLVDFYGDDKLLKTLTLLEGDLPQDVILNVKGIKKFEIKFRNQVYADEYDYRTIDFVNVKIQ